MARQNPRYARPATCTPCSLNSNGFGFAPPSGPLGAPITFLGEALGYEEAIAGEPFYGAAGGVLSRLCQRAGINRSQARIANVVSCQPPGDYLVGAPWEEHAISCCRQYLQPVLDSIPNNGVLIPLGATALGVALNLRGAAGIRVQDFHGCVERITRHDGTGYWVVPTYHPSHLQRGAMNLLEVVTQDLRLADRISQHGFVRSASELVVDPHPEWFVRWIDDYLRRLTADPAGVHLAIDTEYAEKAGGVDESEVVVEAGSRSPITRLNGASDRVTGWTVPYRSPYKEHFDRLITETQRLGGWIWAWNKYADLDHLQAAGHGIESASWVDAMWCLGNQTKVPTWDGKVYTIQEIVEQRLPVVLVGMDDRGQRIPVEIGQYHQTLVRGQKWLAVCTHARRAPIYCTPDHRVWTQAGWKRADALQPTDRIPTSQIGSDELIHGTLLGDGHVTARGDLTLTHGAPQRAWIYAKAHHLGVSAFPRSNGWYAAATVIGAEWRERFYDERGVKHFVAPTSDAALAVWYIDDGNYHRNKGAGGLGRVRLACDAFMKDAFYIEQWFKTRFGVHVRFHGRKRPILVLSKDSARRFFDAVAPYVPPCMEYKLNPAWRGMYNGWLEQAVPRWARIKSVRASMVPRGPRYCVTVDHPTHRFMTVGGLVSNCWHYLQSDLPRGLGFVAPMASDFGAWKHWGKVKELEGKYAAADGVQTWRTAMWLLRAAAAGGQWDLFIKDWHERDVYVLRPAMTMGVPVDRPALEAFHQELQAKLASVLVRIKETTAQGVLKPKGGYAKKPKSMTPPATILGKPKKGGGEAKQQYMTEGVRLVEREVEVEVRACRGCGAVGVGPKHRCPKPKAPRNTARRRRGTDTVSPPPDVRSASAGTVTASTPDLWLTTRRETRWFWQLPFNPDAPAQVLAYLAQQGIEAPIDRKRKSKTTNKKALGDLAKQHRDDPFFQLQLDWKAIHKVDSTYAVGSLNRLDSDNRLHPEYLPKPSTFRDSAQNPNLTNVVADKAGPDGLASGFRRCVVARDGVPSGVSPQELAAWEAKWATS